MPTEADARIVLDRLLRESGWDIEDKSQVSTEEASADGRADYLLKNQRTQPLSVLETKRFSTDPYSAKEQAREYAVSLGAPFVILSNGREHYFWEYDTGDARPVVGLPSRADLERRANLRQHRTGSLQTTLNALPLPARFRFKSEEVEARPYQLRCLEAADEALLAGRRRMLFEMATGTGKTLTIVMLIKRWFQAAACSRVLFLADRIELAKQAKETFDEYFRVEEGRPQPHPRKTIVFAVSERQAVILERLFNKLLPDAACMRIAEQTGRYPAEVRQSFAQKITCYSNNGNPKPLIDRFKFDPLPVIAVSVDMLDTGYDHKKVENLVMLRPTTSAIKYAQMRGRGSRLCPRIGKTGFLIYDFVNNTANFNDPGERYHQPKEKGDRPGPGAPPAPGPDGPIVGPPSPPPPPPPREFTVIKEGSLEDEFRKRQLITVGPDGLEIDRQRYQDQWIRRIEELRQTDPVVRKVLAGEEVTENEWEELAHKLNAPEFWFDEQSLRTAFDQPTGSLNDFIRAALGLYQFPTREQRVERAFTAWVAEHSNSINPDQARMLQLLRNVVLASVRETKYRTIDTNIFTRAPFALLGGRSRMESLFGGREKLSAILEELNQLIAVA